jgi:formate dehydrogenase major subunit
MAQNRSMNDRAFWPVLRQAGGKDPLALGSAAQSQQTFDWKARTQGAKVVKSICPFCAVGCGQNVFVKDEKIVQIEGDPDSPISRGRLCPKGSATLSLVESPLREYTVKYRRPYGTHWEVLPLERAMDMIADRVLKTRRETWEAQDDEGNTLNRCYGIAHLGGATLDNEENYLMKKLYTALGVVQVENQARL